MVCHKIHDLQTFCLTRYEQMLFEDSCFFEDSNADAFRRFELMPLILVIVMLQVIFNIYIRVVQKNFFFSKSLYYPLKLLGWS